MLIDFHAHIATPNTILCTDEPSPLSQKSNKSCLTVCEGLLPEKWTDEGKQLLLNNLRDNPLLQLGEVGLDRRFTDRIPIQQQADNLLELIKAAISLNRTVSLHCVRQTGLLLELLSSVSFPHCSVLWHGFTGSKETASRLSKSGVIISIGPRSKDDLKALYSANQNLVLETDYVGSDSPEHQTILEAHYHRCSGELGLTVQELERHCENQFEAFRTAFKAQ